MENTNYYNKNDDLYKIIKTQKLITGDQGKVVYDFFSPLKNPTSMSEVLKPLKIKVIGRRKESKNISNISLDRSSDLVYIVLEVEHDWRKEKFYYWKVVSVIYITSNLT